MKKRIFITLCYVMLAGRSIAVPDRPFIVAHRGASYDAPENTLPAFELAWQKGADAIEGDFHLTSDGQIVCFHDFDTQKNTGINKIVKSTTLEGMRALDVGRWKDVKYVGTKVPTLSEVIATVPSDKKFFIEIKCGPEILPKLYIELENSTLRPEQIVVISFHSDVIKQLKTDRPFYKAMWLSSLKLNEYGKLMPSTVEVIDVLKTIKADGFSSKGHDALDKAYVQTIREAGYEYHTWTIDDPDKAAKLLEMGIQSITTNRPKYMRKGLK